MFSVEKQHVGKFDVLRLSGDLENHEIDALKEELLAQTTGSRYIAIDIGDTKHYPLSLVIPLIVLRNSSSQSQSTITLVNTLSTFRFILQVAKLDHLFQFVPSLDYLEEEDQNTPDSDSTLPNRPVIFDILHQEKKTQ